MSLNKVRRAVGCGCMYTSRDTGNANESSNCVFPPCGETKETSLSQFSPVVAGSFFGVPHHTLSGLAGLLFPIGGGL